MTSKEAGLHPELLRRWKRIEATLRDQGWQPTIAAGARTAATQASLYKSGASTVKWSYHEAKAPDGSAAALAIDVIDKRYGWEPKTGTSRDRAAAFFKALGAAAKAEGLAWGGDWSKRGIWASYGMGWDPGHVELQDYGSLSTLRAKGGIVDTVVATAGRAASAAASAVQRRPFLSIGGGALALALIFIGIGRRRT